VRNAKILKSVEEKSANLNPNSRFLDKSAKNPNIFYPRN